MKTSTTEPASPDRAADTRERLLLAGLTLFSQLGLEGVRTRQLSEAAGVNQSAIPYHFGGKEGVYAAVLEQTAQDIAARLDLPDAPPATARVAATQLEALMRGFATALLDSEASAARSLLLARTAATHAEVRGDPRRPVHAPARSRDGAGRGHPAGSAGQPRQHPAGPCHPGTGHSLRRRARGAAAAPGRQRLTRAMVGEIADMVGKTALAAARD